MKSRPAHHPEEVYCIVERAFKFSGFSQICTFMQFFEAKLTHNENKKSLKIVMSEQRKRKGASKGPQSILSWSWNWWGGGCLETRSFKCLQNRLPAWKCKAINLRINKLWAWTKLIWKFCHLTQFCTFVRMSEQRKREGPTKGPQSILSWSWNWWGDRGMPWDKVLQMPAKHSRLPAWKCRAEQFILNFSKLGLTNTVVSCCKTILQKAFGWNVQKVPPLLDYIQKHCIGDDDVNLSPPSNSK